MTPLEIFYELFLSNPGVYAIRFIDPKTNKKGYRPARSETGEDLPYTSDVCRAHLKGDSSIGGYAFINKEGLVNWAVADFDGKRGDALQEAVKTKTALAKLGITSWLERSQSGEGIHLWVFVKSPLPAVTLLKILGNNIEEFATPRDQRKTSFDMIIPDTPIPTREYGRLCALPLNGSEAVQAGRTAFVDNDGVPFVDQSKTLTKIWASRNDPEVLEGIAKDTNVSIRQVTQDATNANRQPIDSVPGGVKVFSEYGCKFLASLHEDFKKGKEGSTEPEWHSALGQFVPLHNGRKLAHVFSSTDPRYSYEETDRKFDAAVRENMPKRTATINTEHGTRCGDKCICKELGLNHPWEIAKVPLSRLATLHEHSKIYTAEDLAREALELSRDAAKGKKTGFPWGYDALDDITEIRPKNFIVVAARRSIGKTAWLIDTAKNLATRNIPQYIFSIEMGHEQMALRFLSNISEIDHTLITTGGLNKDQWLKVEEAAKTFAGLPIFLEEYNRNPERMLDIAGDLIYEYGPGVIWVDYLQITHRAASESQKDAVDRAINSFTLMDKILNVPVIALAQLSRKEEEKDTDTELDMWLKDSGCIEEATDVILYLRGKVGAGTLNRKVRLHKDRFRASGINLLFKFIPHIYKFVPVGKYVETTDDGEIPYELNGDSDNGNGSIF